MRHFLSLLMFLTCITAVAENFTYTYEGQTMTFDIIDRQEKTCRLQSAGTITGDGNVTVPSQAKNGSDVYQVIALGSHAFWSSPVVTSVTLLDGIKYIGEYAFFKCGNLTSVEIPNSVTSIGNEAFSYCTNLASIDIPNSVTSIGRGAFDYCGSLTSITIPNSVTYINNNAFSDCKGLTAVHINDIAAWCSIKFDGDRANPLCNTPNLYLKGELVTKLVIPEGVTAIGDYTFEDCTNLTSVDIPNSVTSIGTNAFLSCRGLTSVNIHDIAAWCNIEFDNGGSNPLCNNPNLYLNGEPVTQLVIPDGISSIKDYAFLNVKNITSVLIPNSITSIGNEAFYLCSQLTSIDIPNNVNSIGDKAFGNCSQLTSIDIPNSVKSIGDEAFTSCKQLTSIDIPNSVTIIGKSAFDWCRGLKSVNIHDIAAWCNIEFGNSGANPLCNNPELYINGELVTDLVIPDGITAINNYAFYNCNQLASVHIPNSVTTIGNSAFYQCAQLATMHIPNSVTTIGKSTFRKCSNLTSVNIPDKVTSIEEYTFSQCYGLASVVIPQNVTSISKYAFEDCTSLTAMYSLNTVPPSVVSTCFKNVRYGSVKLYVHQDAMDAYRNAEVWKNFFCLYPIEETGIEDIDDDINDKEEVYYDLGGRRLNAARNGVYIAKGKKMLMVH